MGELADEAKKRSVYLMLGDGESVIAIYRGFKFVPDSYNPTEPDIAQFKLEIDGEIKYYKSRSAKIMFVFDKVKEGQGVKISRAGTGQNTRWQVEPIAGVMNEDIASVPDFTKPDLVA